MRAPILRLVADLTDAFRGEHAPGALVLGGLDVTPAQMQAALRCDAGEWLTALQDLDEFYGSFGSRLPRTIATQLAETRRKLGA